MKNWMIIGLSIILTPIAIALVIFLMAGGDGTYVPAKILFPFWVIAYVFFKGIHLSLIWQAPFLILQFPCYGIILANSNSVGRIRITAYYLLVIHSLVIFGAFMLSMAYGS
jgi:hypothetical protein